MYVVGTHQKRLAEVLLVSTHNIRFGAEIRDIRPHILVKKSKKKKKKKKKNGVLSRVMLIPCLFNELRLQDRMVKLFTSNELFYRNSLDRPISNSKCLVSFYYYNVL